MTQKMSIVELSGGNQSNFITILLRIAVALWTVFLVHLLLSFFFCFFFPLTRQE